MHRLPIRSPPARVRTWSPPMSWTSMGFEAENEERKRDFENWMVDSEMMREAAPDCALHALPAGAPRRGSCCGSHRRSHRAWFGMKRKTALHAPKGIARIRRMRSCGRLGETNDWFTQAVGVPMQPAARPSTPRPSRHLVMRCSWSFRMPPASASHPSLISGSPSDSRIVRAPHRFSAATRAQVDAFYRAAMAAGGRDNGGPGLRRNTTRTTTARSCSIPMATTSRPSAIRRPSVNANCRPNQWSVVHESPLVPSFFPAFFRPPR